MADGISIDDEACVVWVGRVERKMKRKHRVELSLNIEGVERTQTLHIAKSNTPIDGVVAKVQHPTCLQLKALVKAAVVAKPGADDGRTWDVKELELLECPADPLAIKSVLKEPSLWKTLEPYCSRSDEATVEEKKDQGVGMLEDYGDANHNMIRRIVMRLEGREPAQPRIRPPHISFKVLRALEALEDKVELVTVRSSPNAKQTAGAGEAESDSSEIQSIDPVSSTMKEISTSKDIADASSPFAAVEAWNLPDTGDDRVLVSGRHKLTRQEYLESKKHPQVAWIRRRLQQLLVGIQEPPEAQPGGRRRRHVVDVGGGRGDLAIALAMGLGPNTLVTVVDLNKSSLDAGERFAEQCGVADRMAWVCSDFEAYASNVDNEGNGDAPTSSNSKPDVVVALHACGNLSDIALEYAVRHEAAFVICPCCYSKMENQDAATKLAEISERPDLSRRGMHVVNSRRYWELLSQNSAYTILLEEYSRAWSCRNMVMVGWPGSDSTALFVCPEAK